MRVSVVGRAVAVPPWCSAWGFYLTSLRNVSVGHDATYELEPSSGSTAFGVMVSAVTSRAG